jgi:hypothetical protein
MFVEVGGAARAVRKGKALRHELGPLPSRRPVSRAVAKLHRVATSGRRINARYVRRSIAGTLLARLFFALIGR